MKDELAVLKEKGLTRILDVNDESIIDLTRDDIKPSKIKPEKHKILIDRLVLKQDDDTRSRIADSLETAFREGSGRLSVKIRDGKGTSVQRTF